MIKVGNTRRNPLARAIRNAFSPRDLFGSTTQGAIYDYDDFAYLYQKSDGSVLYTALEQPVGLMLDKRYGGNTGADQRSAGAVALVGSATAATFNTSTGAGSVTRVDASNQSSVRFTLTANTFYRITITNSGAATLNLRSGTEAATVWATVAAGATSTLLVLASSAGIISITAASAATIAFTVSALVSLPGLHAYQSTDAARPVLSARYNLLLATATLSTQSVTTLAASYTLTFTGTGTVTLLGTATGVKSAGTNVFTCTAGTLTLTVSGSVTLADLRLTADANSRLPAYQRVTTATDYDSSGFPRFLRIDATDDFMQTASVDPGTDKVFVCAGVTKVADSTAIVLESSTNTNTSAGSFYLAAPGSAAANVVFATKGSAASPAATTFSGLSAPFTGVLTGVGDIAGDISRVRANATANIGDNTNDQGTGNYTAQPIYIGARAGTSLRLNNGRIYPMVIVFKAVTAGEIAATEAWVNARTRAY